MATAVQQSNVTDYLLKKQKEGPKEYATEWSELEELYNKRWACLPQSNKSQFIYFLVDYGIN